MKTLKKSQKIFFILAVMLPAVSGILLFLLPQKTYSENENRYLTTMKPPTISGFFDTSVQKNLTDGANDQFAGRDIWVKFAATLQHLAGFQDIGGVYTGRQGYYFEKILDSDLSANRYSNNVRYIEQFASIYNIKTDFLPVPSKGTVLREYLPENSVLFNADRLLEQAQTILGKTAGTSVININSEFEQKKTDRQLYFKTDHHWTMYAAYLAYTVWCSTKGEEAIPLLQFSPQCVSDAFYGTLYSKAPTFHIQPDLLVLPTKIRDAEIWIDSKKTKNIYHWDKLETKDKYGVYFGGNYGRIDIHMNNCTKHAENKKLLIIKDSFANSMVPFLMEHFQDIIMLDLRYYNKPVSLLIKEIQPDEALVLYELSNFAQDINFFKILK